MEKQQKPSKKLKKQSPETILEAKCFLLYYSLGDLRNINKLLPLTRKINKKITYARLSTMKRKLFWEERIKAKDYNQLVTMKQSVMHNIDGLKQEFYDVIKNTIKRQYVTEKGKTRYGILINDISDLEKAIKLMLLLAGEATDISTVKVEVIETVIQHVIHVVSLYVKDPTVLAQIALELDKGPLDKSKEIQ